jgi:hypothetical protein
MSSAKPAVKARAKVPARAAPKAKAVESGASGDAERLAAEMQRGLADGRLDVISPEALQQLMAACCRTYSAHLDAGHQMMPVSERGGVTSTDVMNTASGLLKAANLAVFELGMWQSWTGR